MWNPLQILPKGLLFIGACLTANLSAVRAADQLQRHHQSTRSLGVGGAYVSIADDLSAFSLNPAGLSRNSENRMLAFDNRYVNRFRNWALQGAIIDGKTEDPLHWGFHFNIVETDIVEMDQYTLGLSYSYENYILVGISQRLTNFDTSGMTRDVWIYTMNAGGLWFVTDFLSLAAAVQNAFRSVADTTLVPVRLTGGLSFNFKYARLSTDLQKDLSNRRLILRGGVEIQPLVSEMSLRAGLFRDFDSEDSGYTLGMTTEPVKGFGIDFGFSDQLDSSLKIFSAGIQLRL